MGRRPACEPDRAEELEGRRLDRPQVAATPQRPDRRRPQAVECYAAQNDAEYFAQLSNAYLGTNMGNDPTTGKPRKNGRAWIKAHEPKEMVALLDRLYQHKTVNDITRGGALVRAASARTRRSRRRLRPVRLRPEARDRARRP